MCGKVVGLAGAAGGDVPMQLNPFTRAASEVCLHLVVVVVTVCRVIACHRCDFIVTWCLVPGARCPVPGARCLVLAPPLPL